MRRRILYFFLCFFFTPALISFSPLLFADESMTLTTYYPSPYGSYNDLYVANKIGIGTTNPTFPLSFGTGLGNKIGLYDGSGGALYGLGIQSNTIQVFVPDATKRVSIGYGTTSSFTPTLSVVGDNVGIGTTAPTAKLEVVCPAGFTNVKGGTPVNQLGCMETAEHGTATWYVAADTCFTTYGGRLPLYSEWYITMNNYALTGETGNWEWLGNSDYYSASACSVAGSSTLTDPNTGPCGSTYSYRCWIPR